MATLFKNYDLSDAELRLSHYIVAVYNKSHRDLPSSITFK
jgi:hypothetical protein